MFNKYYESQFRIPRCRGLMNLKDVIVPCVLIYMLQIMKAFFSPNKLTAWCKINSKLLNLYNVFKLKMF